MPTNIYKVKHETAQSTPKATDSEVTITKTQPIRKGKGSQSTRGKRNKDILEDTGVESEEEGHDQSDTAHGVDIEVTIVNALMVLYR
jgi:hypothetical protein